MALAPYPWLEESAKALNALRDQLPNAILFYGARGSGAFALALNFAQSLLCETPKADGTPCGRCNGCHLVKAGTHPDLKVVVSEFLADAYDLPYTPPENDSRSTKKSREIRIHQFRQLSDFINMSAHQGGRRVVVIYPADMIRAEAAASLLKGIEEPPAGLTYLLVADDIDSVLPTIRSRSRLMRIELPSHEVALDFLKSYKKIKDPEAALAQAGGSPLSALEDYTGLEVSAKERDGLIELLKGGAALTPDTIVRSQANFKELAAPAFFFFMTRWCYDLIRCHFGQPPFYFVGEAPTLQALAERTDLRALMGLMDELNDGRRVSEHPLAFKQVWESTLFKYSAALLKR